MMDLAFPTIRPLTVGSSPESYKLENTKRGTYMAITPTKASLRTISWHIITVHVTISGRLLGRPQDLPMRSVQGMCRVKNMRNRHKYNLQY